MARTTKRRKVRKFRYFATGYNTLAEDRCLGDQYWLEYNSNIKMWRINGEKGIPLHLMGYSPHVEVLKKQLGELREKI